VGVVTKIYPTGGSETGRNREKWGEKKGYEGPMIFFGGWREKGWGKEAKMFTS